MDYYHWTLCKTDSFACCNNMKNAFVVVQGSPLLISLWLDKLGRLVGII